MSVYGDRNGWLLNNHDKTWMSYVDHRMYIYDSIDTRCVPDREIVIKEGAILHY